MLLVGEPLPVIAAHILKRQRRKYDTDHRDGSEFSGTLGVIRERQRAFHYPAPRSAVAVRRPYPHLLVGIQCG